VSPTSSNTGPGERPALRRQLLDKRELHAAGAQASAANASMSRHLNSVLTQLEPQCLGLYWPIRCEFNPRLALGVEHGHSNAGRVAQLALALPYCRREPREMHYRRWDGSDPVLRDECGIPTADASTPVVPDVVLVPCLGYTMSGYRLGYGGGYFDITLASICPQPIAIGVCYDALRLQTLHPQPHDIRMDFVVTESGVFAADGKKLARLEYGECAKQAGVLAQKRGLPRLQNPAHRQYSSPPCYASEIAPDYFGGEPKR
jgi:5-formyltetrahydrofolate cyclo-ligase